MKTTLPIIHVIGLPGAGKTALAEKLSVGWDIPVYRIGEFRREFLETALGEADAWLELYMALSKRGWMNCILETTGLNKRESFLKTALPLANVVTIKLSASEDVLFNRIGRKRKEEQGGKWLFSDSYKDKKEFVLKMFPLFKKVCADIEIETDRLTARQVYESARVKVESFKIAFEMAGDIWGMV